MVSPSPLLSELHIAGLGHVDAVTAQWGAALESAVGVAGAGPAFDHWRLPRVAGRCRGECGVVGCSRAALASDAGGSGGVAFSCLPKPC